MSKRKECHLCYHTAEDNKLKVCQYHDLAWKNLVEKFHVWHKRLGITFHDYLNAILQHPFAGEWVKDVASLLLKMEKEGKVKFKL